MSSFPRALDNERAWSLAEPMRTDDVAPVTLCKTQRAAAKAQRPAIIWFTGLSGAGKSTLANALEMRLHAQGVHTYLLDGDRIRQGLNAGLGFSLADRTESVRRVAEVARLMADAGLVVIVALISPLMQQRQAARALAGSDPFIEIFVDVPIDVAQARDPKGLYARARQGEIPEFTGISSPYEAPVAPEVRVNTSALRVDEALASILAYLAQPQVLGIQTLVD